MEENGRWDDSLKCFNWWETLYYDDITFEGFIHEAYFLRFFEHAREHMLHEQYLADVIEKESKMFVAVGTFQKQFFSSNVQTLTRVGNWINVRTTVQVDGKYRIRFCHECFLFPSISNDLSKGTKLCSGYVDMVCVHPETHAITTLPNDLSTEVKGILPIPKPSKPMKKVHKKLALLNLTELDWIPQSYDSDFTAVVYQAKYLQYYETCFKMNLERITRSTGTFCFSVVTLKFKIPARVMDKLKVRIVSLFLQGRYKIVANLEIIKEDQILNQTTIESICLDAARKLVPIEVYKTGSLPSDKSNRKNNRCG